MYIKRHLEKCILESSKKYPVLLLTGQRQVGKSTMLNHIKEDDRRYVTFDDYNARILAQTDPGLFFETYGYKLIIDEFQRVPSILLEIKRIVDEKALNNDDNNGMFWLTGSQKFIMMKSVSESLAGRIAIFEMSSLSNSEINDINDSPISFEVDELKKREYIKNDVNEIFKKIFYGGMPKIICDKTIRDEYYRNYINTYIERDIRDISNIGKLDQFYTFLVYMAAITSQEIKYDSIANNIGVSIPTVKAWLDILISSGIVYILRPYSNNITKRLVKTPKVYFMDTGLAAYLTKWPNSTTLEHGPMAGAFFETYVVSELIKNYLNNNKTINLYYYRDFDQKEIDLLSVDAVNIYPIEIKKAKFNATADKNLSVLNKFNLEVKPMIIFSMSDELIPLNRQAYFCPIEKI